MRSLWEGWSPELFAKVDVLFKSNYLPVRVDQDANPDLSSRYGDWGWPATNIFASDGE